jgi:hypothetical protein
MRIAGRAILLPLVILVVAMAFAVYGARVSPAAAPSSKSPAMPLSGARFFMLLPDGHVEITDGWSRRVFRWDGQRWIQTESLSLQPSSSR